METQIIIMPNQEKLANDAIARNAALPATLAPAGLQLCCGQAPVMKRGGATLTTLKCPVCGKEDGAWSLDDEFLISCWNRGNYGDPRVACSGETDDILCVRGLSLQYLDWCRKNYQTKLMCHTIEWALVSNPEPGVFRVHNRFDLGHFAEVRFAPPQKSASVSTISWDINQCVHERYTGALKEVKYLTLYASNQKWSRVLKQFHTEVKEALTPSCNRLAA